MLWSSPFLERFHFTGGAQDYFRYTCPGAKVIFEDAGLEVVDMKKIGDAHMASGALLGFGAGDLSTQHVDHALLSNFSAVTDTTKANQWLYISCVLVARRPAHPRPAKSPAGAREADESSPPRGRHG